MQHSIAARLTAARGRLRDAGIPPGDADLSARLLAQQVLGWDAVQLLTESDQQEPPDFSARFASLVERRATREPLAYITGEREFWSLPFDVSPAVLIPRPETELLVEIVLERFPDRSTALTIADVCTGSGCVAVSIAREYPNARLVATDVSSEALEVARRNATRHSVSERIRFLQGDLLEDLERNWDVIVANPPYVLDRDRAALQPEVRDHEPALALFGGTDGLSVIRRLVEQAVTRLRPNGLFIFEFGDGQAAAVDDLIRRTPGFTLVALRADLRGIPRAAIARRSV